MSFVSINECDGIITNADPQKVSGNYADDMVGVKAIRDGIIFERDFGTKNFFPTPPLRPNAFKTISGAIAGTSGVVRLYIPSHGLSAGTCYVDEVVGTVEAIGRWAFTVYDSNYIELTGSTFSHTYVSGGIFSQTPITIIDGFVFEDTKTSTEYHIIVGLDSNSYTRIFVYDPASSEPSKWIELTRYVNAKINGSPSSTDTSIAIDTIVENGNSISAAYSLFNNWFIYNTTKGSCAGAFVTNTNSNKMHYPESDWNLLGSGTSLFYSGIGQRGGWGTQHFSPYSNPLDLDALHNSSPSQNEASDLAMAYALANHASLDVTHSGNGWWKEAGSIVGSSSYYAVLAKAAVDDSTYWNTQAKYVNNGGAGNWSYCARAFSMPTLAVSAKSFQSTDTVKLNFRAYLEQARGSVGVHLAWVESVSGNKMHIITYNIPAPQNVGQFNDYSYQLSSSEITTISTLANTYTSGTCVLILTGLVFDWFDNSSEFQIKFSRAFVSVSGTSTSGTRTNLQTDIELGSSGLGWADNDDLVLYRFPCLKYN